MATDRMLDMLAEAARSRKPVAGLTHNFYRYPARFSPEFAAAAIRLFSKPGDIVYDPYMGGGTTIIEALVAGRRTIGSDVNSLALFIVRVKTTVLNQVEREAIAEWGRIVIPRLKYTQSLDCRPSGYESGYTRNLGIPRARFIKKVVAIALASLDQVPSQNTQDFVRCALLRTAQWALDGRRTHSTVAEFRRKLRVNLVEMLEGATEFDRMRALHGVSPGDPVLVGRDVSDVNRAELLPEGSHGVDLVVTSPPYPGVHVLYHRWQVDGRKETPAPYWICGCQDGQGEAHYNFGGRHGKDLDSYFAKSLGTLKAIRGVMRRGAYMIQMVAFANIQRHLPRYLANMQMARFQELRDMYDSTSATTKRIWRGVPNRKWHATLKGRTSGAREVVLIHRAV